MANIEVAIRKSADKKITYSLNIAYAEDPTLVSRLDELNGEVVGVTSSAKIAAAIDSKEAIADAVNGKGGNITADTPLDEYAEGIQAIPVSVVGKPSDGPRVRFFDYDGTLLKTQYVPKGGAATSPEIPQHERLLFQEWNNDFDNVTSDLDVGAIYTTKSGKLEFDLDMNSLTGFTQCVGITLKSGTVTIEWGDGQSETLTTIGATRVAHTYASSGKYTVMVSGTGEWLFSRRAFYLDGSGNTKDNYTITSLRLVGLNVTQSDEAFAYLFSCRTITVDATSTKSNLSFFAYAETLQHFNIPRKFQLLNSMFTYCGSLRRIVFPAGITSIPNAFISNSGIREDIILPANLRNINWEAFVMNGRFSYPQEMTIPPLVTFIATGAFSCLNAHCTIRKLIMKPVKPPQITIAFGWNAGTTFPSNGSLKEIIVPAGCAETYKNATNWSYYADIIKEEDI